MTVNFQLRCIWKVGAEAGEILNVNVLEVEASGIRALIADLLGEHGIPFHPESYLTGDYREKSGYQAAKLLLIGERLPQALVCANDNMAIGAMRAFREAGLRIPDDVAVTGFDDTPLAELLGLSTVAIPNYERGYLAAQHLIANIEGAQSYETFKIQARVVWRGSVGVPRGD